MRGNNWGDRPEDLPLLLQPLIGRLKTIKTGFQ